MRITSSDEAGPELVSGARAAAADHHALSGRDWHAVQAGAGRPPSLATLLLGLLGARGNCPAPAAAPMLLHYLASGAQLQNPPADAGCAGVCDRLQT